MLNAMPGDQVPRWIKTDKGQIKWEGPAELVVQRGPATLVFERGELERVEKCRLPDGSRGTVYYSELRDLAPAWRDGTAGLGGDRRPGEIIIEASDVQFFDWPELEEDLLASEHICSLVKNNPIFAAQLYAALCNIEWRRDGFPWATTWREAGRIVARLEGDLNERAYLYYNNQWAPEFKNVHEGTVADEVANELLALGWTWREAGLMDERSIAGITNGRRLAIALALDMLGDTGAV
jgi:hypothetical protein